MKDSGIEWIGEIPESWGIRKNKYLLSSIYSGGTPTAGKEEFYTTDNGIPFVSISDMSNSAIVETTKKQLTPAGLSDKNLVILPVGTILYSIYATIGAVSELSIEATISQALLALSLKSIVEKAYYKYSLFAMRDYILSNANGNTQFNLNAEKVRHFFFPFPEISEQRAISAYLDRQCALIDNITEKTKATIEEYKKLRQAVITQAVTKGVRGDRPMKDSGIEWIGEIPEEWHLVKITRILDYSHPYPIGDGDHGLIKTDDYMDEGIPYLRVQNLGWGTSLLLENVVFISEEKNEQIKNSILQPNDILFAKTGATIGKTGIVPDTLPISNTTSHIGKITLSKNYCARFAFYVLSSTIGYKQFWEIAIQKTTRPELSIEETKSIQVLLPDTYDEQNEIAAYLDKKCAEIDSIIAKKEQFLTELETYKKSMIYEYVTGKKEVPQA